MNNFTETAKRMTSSKLSLEQKLASAFLDACGNSKTLKYWQSIVYNYASNTDFFSFYLSFHPWCKLYPGQIYQSIFAYSMKKKDSALFNMLLESFFVGFVFQAQTAQLLSNAITETDDTDEQACYTDVGNYTDISPGFVYEAFALNYTVASSEIQTAAGEAIDSFSSMVSTLNFNKKFIGLVKPARVTIIFLYAPLCYIGATSLAGATTIQEGATTTSTVFSDPVKKQELLNIAETNPSSLFNNTNSDRIMSFSDADSNTTTDDYIKLRRNIRTSSTSIVSDNIWTDFSFLSDNFDTIPISINSAQYQSQSSVYIATIEFIIPKA